MGNPNSKSSFKQNNSVTNSINFINSQEFSFNAGNSGKSVNKQADALTKFSWNYGGTTVYLTGSFNKWKQTIPLQRQGQQFSITILLPRGLHYYKFIVDGQWRFSPQDPSMPDNNGHINNYIDTTNYHLLIQKDTSSSKPSNSPSQDQNIKSIQQFNKQAPKLPPHYDHCTYLTLKDIKQNNNQQSKMQIQIDDPNQFQKSLTQDQVYYLFNSCHCLGPPTHVTIDHLITQIQKNGNNYTSMVITQRFKSKYTTFKYFTLTNN